MAETDNTSTDVYECTRCGAAFGITGSDDGSEESRELNQAHNDLVTWHEDKLCASLVRTPLERARLLIDLQWDDEDGLPSDAAATALLALAEEQHTANLIAVLALPSAVKNKALTDAKNRMLVDVVERLGIGGAS